MLQVKKAKLRKRRKAGGAAVSAGPGVCAALPRAVAERAGQAVAAFPYAVSGAADIHLRHLPPASDREYVPEIEIKLEFSEEEEEESDEPRRAGPRGCVAAYGEGRREKRKAELAPWGPGSQPRMAGGWKAPSSLAGGGQAVRERRAAKGTAPPAFGHTRRRKNTSEVWQFFSTDAGDPCRAVCTLCQASVGRGKWRGHCNTTALRRHMEGRHPLQWGRRKRAGGRAQEQNEEEEGQVAKGFPSPDPAFGTSRALCSPTQPRSGVPPAVPLGAPRFQFMSSDSSEEEGRGRAGTPLTDPSPASSEEESSESSKADAPLPRGRGRGRKGSAQGGHPKLDLTTPYPEMLVGLGDPRSGRLSLPSRPLVPPGTKRRRSTSAVWQFFYIDCSNVCRAVCTLCRASVSRGKLGSHFGTSALMRHLEGKHPLEWGRGKAAGAPAVPRSSPRAERPSDEEDEPVDDVFLSSAAAPDRPKSPCASPGGAPVPMGERQESGAPAGHEGEKALAPAAAPLPPPRSQATVPERGGDVTGKYTPSHPRAQAWHCSIAELLCGMALPCSFVSAKPFLHFMAQADPRYRVPSPAFFSRRAVPQLRRAVGLGIALELQRARLSRVHLSAHVWAPGPAGEHLALAAHWLAPCAGSVRRRQAVLCVRALQKERAPAGVLQVLAEQLQLWLAPSSLSPGFLVSGGSPSVERAAKDGGHAHLPCFAHCLSQLVLAFLHQHRSIQGVLGAARAVCAHFARSPEARRGLAERQRQRGLAPRRLRQEAGASWDSTYHMLERLLELQPAVQEYAAERRLGQAGLALSASQWKLLGRLVALLRPFEMARREARAARASLSQVLPQVRYLHIFLGQLRLHWESQGGEEAGPAAGLAESLALQLSSDPWLREMFRRPEYVLATLLDPRFKGRIDAILPPGADLAHWKQLLVWKVKERLAPAAVCPSSSSSAQPNKAFCTDLAVPHGAPASQQAEVGPGEPPGARGLGRKGSVAPPLIQKEKTLIEHLESVGLLASLPAESHSACMMVERYLSDSQTIGARDDVLGYWEKQRWLWPALAEVAVLYLSCPPSAAFLEHIFAAPDSPFSPDRRPPAGESLENLVFLQANLGNFPNYPPPPLLCSEDDSAGASSGEEGSWPARSPAPRYGQRGPCPSLGNAGPEGTGGKPPLALTGASCSAGAEVAGGGGRSAPWARPRSAWLHAEHP